MEGRFTDPTRHDEFTVNVAGFDVLGGEVGERFEFDSFSQRQTDGNEFRPDVTLEGPGEILVSRTVKDLVGDHV